jgi:hypothetical protein
MQLNNLNSINYLSNYDLLYKNNIKNIRNIIKVKSLVVNFTLNKNIINNYINLKESNQNINFKFYLLCYLCFSIRSHINYKIMKNVDSNYSLIINIKNKNYLDFLIHKIYIYFLSNNSFSNSTNFNKIKSLMPNLKILKDKHFNFINDSKKDKKKVIKEINFKLEIPLICIHLLNFYPKFFFDKFDYKNDYLIFNFQIRPLKTEFYGINSVLNLPFFWIFR